MMISEPLSQYEEILKYQQGWEGDSSYRTVLYRLSGKTQETVGLCVQRIVRLTECHQGLHERQWHGLDMFRCRPNRTLISKIVKELIGWQSKAA